MVRSRALCTFLVDIWSSKEELPTASEASVNIVHYLSISFFALHRHVKAYIFVRFALWSSFFSSNFHSGFPNVHSVKRMLAQGH